MADGLRIVVLEGDETGQELLEAALRAMDSEVLGIDIELERFDLSLDNRRETDNGVVTEAAEAMAEARFGLKAATVTPEGKDDVGSPNRLLREAIGGKVIIRTGRRIPGVNTVAGLHHPVSVVRMAVGDAYGAEQWREEADGDEYALRTEKISRSVCKAVAEYSFRTAERIEGKVYGGPEVDGEPRLRGHAQGGDGRRRRAPLRGRVRAGADRRHLRGPDQRRRRLPAGDPRAEPRRRLPVGPGDAHVRVDRRRGVGAAGAGRRLRAAAR